MTTVSLTLAPPPPAQYHLPEPYRQAILAYSDNPASHINSARLKVIERQRQRFINIYNQDGLSQ